MKKTSLSIAVMLALSLSACSTFKSAGIDPGEVSPVKDRTADLSTEFKREGVKVYYTLSGNVDRIEAKGFAEVWRGNYEHVAELEAKEKLVRFLRGESVSSTRKTQIIAKSIERAQDNTLNKFKSLDGTIANTAEDIELEEAGKTAGAPNTSEENSKNNTALRKTSVNNAHIVTSTTTITSSGRLTAIYKLSGNVVNDGKLYVGTYVWTPRDQKAARSIVRLMDAR
jgi:hypothetical protein